MSVTLQQYVRPYYDIFFMEVNSLLFIYQMNSIESKGSVFFHRMQSKFMSHVA